MPTLDPDRLFPLEPQVKTLARDLFEAVYALPIISPHGHTDPRWFAEDTPFENPTELFVTPDHYVFRMLYSQGIGLDDLGIPRSDGSRAKVDPRNVWKIFAQHYYLFRGTPSQLWIDHSLSEVFGVEQSLCPDTAEEIYAIIDNCLAQPEFRPRALFDRFNIEVLATTEGALDDLVHHAQIEASDWNGDVITTYRPDTVIDPDVPSFFRNLKEFGELTGEDTMSWQGYLNGHRKRRQDFIAHGATASDHGHASAKTADLTAQDAESLFNAILKGDASATEKEIFRAQMLTEMAKMSLDDRLVMQIHAGSRRNHAHSIYENFGSDKGFDIPGRTDYVNALNPLLNVAGHHPNFSLIVFTLDETSYGRELAPLAGVYPALKLGPAWWFFDSPDGMRRFREMTTETAGFYNTVGFNDDTRAFCSIPARHDVARRVDCAYLATLVASGRLGKNDAFEVAEDLTYNLAKKAYRL